VENPVSILDQEESKKFLCGKPEDKYKFFMKATDLERMDMNYAATMDQLRELEAARIRAHEALEPLQVAEEEAKRRFKQHDALAKLEKKVAQLECDLMWAAYNEGQRELDESTAVRCPVQSRFRRVLPSAAPTHAK
jgi:structural maintenance of chromosomes protein 6